MEQEKSSRLATQKNQVTFSKKRKIKSEKQTKFEKNDYNGQIFESVFLPKEILLQIFYYINKDTLLACQQVCKYWKELIQHCVWYKKAEYIVGKPLTYDEKTSWLMYYYLCSKMPFNKNLIKNHSGEKGSIKDWLLPPLDRIKWITENSSAVPLPLDPSYNGINSCFVTSYNITWKWQTVDLIEKGFSKYVLDHLQPPIKISEWYSCKNGPALYLCDIELLKENGEKKLIYNYIINENGISKTVQDHYTFSKIIDNDKKWFKYEHEFKQYGKGLRQIKFIHGGRGKPNFNAELFDCGSKMARACIQLDIPALDSTSISSLPNYY